LLGRKWSSDCNPMPICCHPVRKRTSTKVQWSWFIRYGKVRADCQVVRIESNWIQERGRDINEGCSTLRRHRARFLSRLADKCALGHTPVAFPIVMYSRKKGPWSGIEYPRTPGHEVVRVIDEVGAGVSEWTKWQRVGVGWHGGHHEVRFGTVI
jgi:hypothetical protein